ncbi:argonaute-binding protein 1 [Zalerion maritima]|uniref:Argonaute-binding protein 1 n=1 Tax=Zalerion maritima TaxID=339359 RepID=A0AAD5WVK0_9PEZI|nr:argonaute-binding protein 1 [Zalerion maritima]
MAAEEAKNIKPEVEDDAEAQYPKDTPLQATLDGPSETTCVAPVTAGTKKKKKKKGKSAKKTGTGFEESFADAPVTPEEFAHERDIVYHSSVPFPERIEECIQRWRAKRRMDSYKNNLFTKYLIIGGVESGVRQFTGFDQDAAVDGEMDKDEIRAATAIDVVNTGNNEIYYMQGEGWDVDFAGVVAGFFSYQLLEITSYHREHTLIGIQVVENFLNYVLHHNVCPEYEENINKARIICKQAKEEAFDIPRIQYILLPGSFNQALADQCEPEGPDKDQAAAVLRTVMTWGDDELIQKFPAKGEERLALTGSQDRRLEILEVNRAEANLMDGDEFYSPIAPIGRILARDTFIEDGFSVTPTEEEWRAEQAENPTVESFSLWINDAVLALMRPGQKIRADILETKQGIRILGKISDVYPSYYVFLPQNLMVGWKQPVENPRPAPTTKDIKQWMAFGDEGDIEGEEKEVES